MLPIMARFRWMILKMSRIHLCELIFCWAEFLKSSSEYHCMPHAYTHTRTMLYINITRCSVHYRDEPANPIREKSGWRRESRPVKIARRNPDELHSKKYPSRRLTQFSSTGPKKSAGQPVSKTQWHCNVDAENKLSSGLAINSRAINFVNHVRNHRRIGHDGIGGGPTLRASSTTPISMRLRTACSAALCMWFVWSWRIPPQTQISIIARESIHFRRITYLKNENVFEIYSLSNDH